MTVQVVVQQLSACPAHLTAVGTWIYTQWWSRAHESPEVVFALLRTHVVPDRVPFTLVALADGLPVGSCSIIENDCVHRPQLAPWVAAVYVQPTLRRRGVASALLQEAAAIAARTGIEALYIDCLAATAPVYARNGWNVHEREVGDPDSVVMVRRTAG